MPVRIKASTVDQPFFLDSSLLFLIEFSGPSISSSAMLRTYMYRFVRNIPGIIRQIKPKAIKKFDTKYARNIFQTFDRMRPILGGEKVIFLS